ncbi:hypothetical protein H6F80_02535 [Leptolyngbya sp. FACHB-711]|nr:hypothetical protein [Leptolyngbya sp. FACHB-711]MBD2023302.1 hypothetical protein [Leptolyngbya sp. FACHB-711]
MLQRSAPLPPDHQGRFHRQLGRSSCREVDISGGKRAVWQKNPGLANEQGTGLRSY